MNIPIVYENDHFVVVNKPVNIAVQDEATQPGIIPVLTQQLNLPKLWLVHRLDKVTSGLLLLAKNAEAASLLSQCFAQRKMQKYYLALSDKKPKKKQGTVIGDMHKIRDGKWALSPSTVQPAISQFFSSSVAPKKRLFIVKPYTGKTHQIRVMLKSLGSPIIGDTAYKGIEEDRTYLHAFGLQFELDGTSHSFSCLPEQGRLFNCQQWQQIRADFFQPWTLPWPILPNATTAMVSV
ncbi:TIGR01621 family pseudouridine synthase [Aliiglaciecola sp. M165]|uniref:TIGR01621 family pseudouridine synthase n=1 Tax=Aliiglaciecola sp. M165 TaxID=2593649 RepID=UPI00117FFF7D|nr:TIGR01621 family pseudouridine synthase [Aliiglaciecola sp. M165]TRY29426.1 TIGR01621 family pseudouridine synthase [Aliiglaciecola sp. M165]